MKQTSGYISNEKAHSLISKHEGLNERKIIGFGNEFNTHHCILWSNWIEETDAYGNKSPNRYVIDEFYWQEEVKKN
jgi:hypothetical protein